MVRTIIDMICLLTLGISINMEKCWKCEKSIRSDALCWWAIKNDTERSVPVHRACWLELREKELGIKNE